MRLHYILKRLLIAIPVFFGISMLTYFLASLSGGSPLITILSSMNATQEQIDLKIQEFGLDQPVFIQYLNWLRLLLQGSLGYSYRTNEAVLTMILERIGPTLILTFSSLLISLLVAYPLGIIAAVKPNTALDYVISGFSFIAAATPNFFSGLIMIVIFSVHLKILPMGGMYTYASKPDFLDMLRHLILPATVLSFQQIGSFTRQIRGSTLETLHEDYVRTARSKGLPFSKIMLRHVTKNSMIPIVTVIGLELPFLLGGAVVTEQIFSWPGLGSLMILSLNARDYPVIMGITVIIAVGVLLGNLIVDSLYGFLDPRISYQ